jgi:CDP-4-dehydro-6-deoxyglucose reductase, E3
MSDRHTVELVRSEQLSPTVKLLVWRDSEGRPLPFVAGQWFNFDVPTSGGVVRRAYSIASAPSVERPDELEIAVTRVPEIGNASLALHEFSPGLRLAIDGPHGFFTREQALHLPALFVGTGTGVCPLRAMIQDELRESSGPPLHLLFGCRTEADILWNGQLRSWAAAHPRFSFDVTLSRAPADFGGLRGYVQHHLPALLCAGERPQIYVCGLTKMVSEVRRVAKQQLGYDRRAIHSERYD